MNVQCLMSITQLLTKPKSRPKKIEDLPTERCRALLGQHDLWTVAYVDGVAGTSPEANKP